MHKRHGLSLNMRLRFRFRFRVGVGDRDRIWVRFSGLNRSRGDRNERKSA